jgi:hypothetical protein
MSIYLLSDWSVTPVSISPANQVKGIFYRVRMQQIIYKDEKIPAQNPGYFDHDFIHDFFSRSEYSLTRIRLLSAMYCFFMKPVQ